MLSFFPFTPYAVQEEALSFLKRCIASKTPAFLDAPTGTGKTAMLFHLAWDWINTLENPASMCSKNKHKQVIENCERSSASSTGALPDWAVDAGEKAAIDSVSASRSVHRALIQQLIKIAERYANPEDLRTLLEYVSRERKSQRFTAEPLRKQDPAMAIAHTTHTSPYAFLFAFLGLDKFISPDTYLSLTQVYSTSSNHGYSDDAAAGYMGRGRVVLSTRTHAQIAQIVEAFRKFKQIIERQIPKYFNFSTEPVVSLAGRDVYCLQSSSATDIEDIGELCEDLRKNSKCNYYNPAKVLIGTALCLSGMYSPSEFRKKCSALEICPYYSARHAATHASIVLLSHAMLIEELYGSVGSLRLLDSAPLLLLVDEAHAMPGALEARNSCITSEADLDYFIKALNKYLAQARLGLPSQIARLLDRLAAVINIIKRSLNKIADHDTLMPVNDVLNMLKLKGFDFFEALNLLLSHRIQQKLCTYCKELDMSDRPRQSIYSVVSMIRILAELDTRELYKVCVSGDQHRELRLYRFSSAVDINARSPFRKMFSITRDGCRHYEAQICFVSGTLDPFSYYTRELLGQSVDQSGCCSIDHITPPSRTLVQQVSLITMAGVQQKALFVASSWTPEQVKAVVQCIMEIAKNGISCTGTLVFLPSYHVVEKLRELCVSSETLLADSTAPAVLFERVGEPIDRLMETYALKLSSSRCVLFASAGGRVSEGLDFKDDLCRRLVIVGIPFPNLGNPIVREKHRLSGGRFCIDHAFTLINQCMGRGVRHKNDWCSILLFDSRFAEHIDKLSSWARGRVQATESIETAVEQIRAFEAKIA